MKALLLLALAGLLSAQEFTLGNKVADFAYQDVEGKAHQFAAFQGKIAVVTFIATKCPISNDYNERMKELYNEYQPKGVQFLFLNSNSTEPDAEVVEHRNSNSFPFPVHRDHANIVADRFGAQFTPEAYVIDKDGRMQYHGAIDDSRNAARITEKPLRKALDALLAGKPVEKAETKAFGCTIKRVKKAS